MYFYFVQQNITHNKDRNGIEIVFDYHIEDDTKQWLRDNSFRWSKRQGIWWRPFSEAMWKQVHDYFKKSDIPEIEQNNVCDICGKKVKKFGLGTHRRMAHGISVRREIIVTKGDKQIKRSIPPRTPVPVKTIEQKLVKKPALLFTKQLDVGLDLSECKRPDSTHLYTELDLWILIGRICQTVLNEDKSNPISILGYGGSMDVRDVLIRDFERRFECKFDEIVKANPDVRPGANDHENYRIATKYASLKYSR